MTPNYNIVGTILFSQSLAEIKNQLKSLRKDRFDPLDRIVINQDTVDEYPYVDGVGTKLIEIQKIINSVDISNCFILLVTPNTNILEEIEFVTQFYSVDTTPIEFLLVEGRYDKQIKKYKNTACLKLWNHLYVGTDGNVNPCCLADRRFPIGNINNDDLDHIIKNKAQPIRNHMMQGYRNRACATCYEREDFGLKNGRIECDPTKNNIIINDIDIRLNNICNFKCRSCSEYFSSAIQQETIKMYGKDAVLGFEKVSLETTSSQFKNQQLTKILSKITPDIKRIYFAGGEPLLMPEHYKILEHLIDIQNTNLNIKYNTNLSTLCYKNLNVIDYWQKFDNINIGASIDCSDAAAEYMRHGTVWKNILNNIDLIKNQASHVKLKIASTVSFLTIKNLIELQCTWIDQKLFDVSDFEVSLLTSPIFLSPSVLPQHHKNRLSILISDHIKRFDGTDLALQWQSVLQWMNNNDHTYALIDFKNRTKTLDTHRNESFQHVFPEFCDLYTS